MKVFPVELQYSSPVLVSFSGKITKIQKCIQLYLLCGLSLKKVMKIQMQIKYDEAITTATYIFQFIFMSRNA